MIIVFVTCLPAGAQEPVKSVEKAQQIHITSDNLLVDSETRFAEFSGNVKAVKDNFVIVADKLTVFYQTGDVNDSTGSDNKGAIDKIVARGNVNITMDDKIAQTQEATYTIKDQLIVLAGKDSRIIIGNDSITGSKIMLYRSDGRIKVEGPVEGKFYTLPVGNEKP